MSTIDPSTGRPLPADAIQRVLHITAKVHVYAVPPLASNKGHSAASWTTRDPIFTARLRVLETSVRDQLSVAVLLEDPASGDLFAAAPYGHPSAVEQATDSSRFFAVRVVGDGGRKATLGMGFEERSDAFDFNIALQDAAKALGLVKPAAQSAAKRGAPAEPKPVDYSLKEGQTITVSIGGRGGSSKPAAATPAADISAMPFLPPPPSAADVKAGRSAGGAASATAAAPPSTTMPSAKDLGFDDGEFGEFQ